VVSKDVVKPSQWMKHIGVGRISPSRTKEGHEQVLLFNKDEARIMMSFLDMCTFFEWEDIDRIAVTRVCDSPRRYAFRIKSWL